MTWQFFIPLFIILIALFAVVLTFVVRPRREPAGWVLPFVELPIVRRFTVEQKRNDFLTFNRQTHGADIEAVRETGELAHINTTLREQVKQRKQAEKALRESEAKFRTLTEMNSAAIFIYQNGRNRYVNPAAEAITGYARAELLTMNFWDVVHPDFYHDVEEKELTRRKGKCIPSRHELRIQTKGGRECWVDVTLGLVKYDGSAAVLGTAFNITERKRAEQQVLQAERLAALGRLAAALAHEINNPLQIIQGYLDLILDFQLEPGEREQYLHTVRQQITHLKDINQRILNYSRAKPGPHRSISVAGLIEHVLVLAHKQLQQNGVQVTKELQPVPEILATPAQLTQVFLNLVINAVESVPAGEGRVHIALRHEGDQVVISFWNNGSAIPSDILPHIFEPFYTTKAEGTGLGLWVSHKLVQQHGGSLDVENLKGRQGVVFTVTLPVASERI